MCYEQLGWIPPPLPPCGNNKKKLGIFWNHLHDVPSKKLVLSPPKKKHWEEVVCVSPSPPPTHKLNFLESDFHDVPSKIILKVTLNLPPPQWKNTLPPPPRIAER